jgi:hypothetical protein
VLDNCACLLFVAVRNRSHGPGKIGGNRHLYLILADCSLFSSAKEQDTDKQDYKNSGEIFFVRFGQAK